MRALEYGFSPGRWLIARHAGARAPALAVPCSGLRLRSVPPPAPPGGGRGGWVPVAVRLAGICGSDVALLRGRTGPTLSPFVSFPAVLGHEVLGVAQAGALAGRRVVLDPFLPCRTRGLPPCPACAEGRTALCHRFADGALAPGMLLGYCRDLPGGWAEQVLAHESQLHEVPEGLADEAAVLAEPLAVALHAVLAAPPGPGSRVLVLGAGTIGLCVLAALRLLPGPGGVHAVAVARHPGQARLAAALGARAVSAADAAERFAVAEGWGAPRPGLLGARGWIGGFDRVFDAVGSGGSMAAALRLARAGGRVDLLGCSGRLPGLDLTWAWAHELEVHGYCGYGAEPSAGGAHTIEVAMGLQAGHPEVDLGALLTHRFPLERHREALRAAFFHRRSGAIKVAFAPGEGA